VIATTIGTQDSTANLVYQPPPGVIDQGEGRGDQFGTTQIQINERSMRLLAGNLDLYDRAEAYYRFPEGQKSFMGYEELRVWARGRGNGWGPSGELQFFIKAGRDADNFYLFRTPVNSGFTQQAWEPEVRVEFKRFYDLRARVENASLQNSDPISGCTALDSALIIASLPLGATSPRYAACDGGYMIYTVDPRLIPPSLASVQEMAVGFVRVSDQAVSTPIAPTDTLELWVDDIRLTGVVDSPGYAGHFGLEIRGADIFDFRGNVSRTDQNFRQLGEQPSFNTRDALDLASTVHIGKLLPTRFGIAMPLTINHRTEGSNPFFTSSSDVLADGIVGLRTPRQSATTYSVLLRRASPLEDSPYGILFNNVTLSSVYASSNTRSEYQRGRANNLTVGLDYNIAPDTLATRLPGWLDRAVGLLPNWLLGTAPLAALRRAEYRYSPTLFSFSSAFAKGSNQRTSFTKPAASPTDTGRAVTGENHVWENKAAVNLQPLPSLNVRWDLSSLRDLRDYGDTTDAGRAARFARRDLLGQDLGLERDRTMHGFVAFSPRIIRWLSPTVSLGSQFTMTRDPNARSLVPVSPESDDVRLPRRINTSQVFNAGADLDLGTLLEAYLGWAPAVTPFARLVLPVNVGYSRTLLSSLDRAASMPGLGFQFGLGGVDDFRRQDGRLASSAGASNAFNVSGTLRLPGEILLTNRFQRNDTRNWTRRQEDQHIVTDGWLRIFPDISLNGTWRTPSSVARIVSSIGGQAGFTLTNRSSLTPSPTIGAEPDRTAQRVRSFPASVAAQWGVLGGFSTTAGYDLSLSTDLRPGSITDVTRRTYAAGISKTFGPRPAWKLPSDIRTNVNFLRQDTDGHVRSISTGNSSRLTDNGRYEFSLSGNTEVSETMSFELTGSRIVNFDENFNRRNVLTVFSAVMNLQFGKF
jgi:hypothetical protein